MGMFDTKPEEEANVIFNEMYEKIKQRNWQLFIQGFKAALQESKNLITEIHTLAIAKSDSLNRNSSQKIIFNSSEDFLDLGYILGYLSSTFRHAEEYKLFYNKTKINDIILIISNIKNIEGFNLNVILNRIKKINISKLSSIEIDELKRVIKSMN